MRQMSAMPGTITEAIAASVVSSSSERESSAPALTSCCRRACARSARRARLALGVEQQLALGLALLAQRGGADERLRDRLDLDQVGLARLDRRAAAERQRGVAQARDRRRDRCPRRSHAAMLPMPSESRMPPP